MAFAVSARTGSPPSTSRRALASRPAAAAATCRRRCRAPARGARSSTRTGPGSTRCASRSGDVSSTPMPMAAPSTAAMNGFGDRTIGHHQPWAPSPPTSRRGPGRSPRAPTCRCRRRTTPPVPVRIDRPDVVVVRRPRDGRQQRLDVLAVEGVAPVGPVDGDGGDPAVDLVADQLRVREDGVALLEVGRDRLDVGRRCR